MSLPTVEGKGKNKAKTANIIALDKRTITTTQSIVDLGSEVKR
jgi:hypothetical protein